MSSSATITCTVCQNAFPEESVMTYKEDRICTGCKDEYFQRMREGLPEMDASGLAIASIGSRFVAAIIDGIVLTVMQSLIMFGLVGAMVAADSPVAALVAMPIYMLFTAAYYIVLVGWKGATLGKMAMRIKIVTPTGGDVGYLRAFIRYLGTFVSSIILMIGYIMAFSDEQNRALHDRMAGTLVVQRKPATV
jgi:uncharacterized RDD family membrane protein YckC